jgi:hypothetical protein
MSRSPEAENASAEESAPGWALLVACVGILGVCASYMLSPQDAVTLTRPFDFEAARAGAVQGAVPMRAASAFAIPGNMLFAAAAFRFASARGRRREVEALGWWLAGLSGAHFTVVDTMVGLVLPPLAGSPDTGAFLLAKTLFDMLFVAGTFVYGLGAVLVSRAKVGGAALSLGLFLAGALCCVASGGCFVGAPFGRFMGLGILLATVAFGALGAVYALGGRARQEGAGSLAPSR